MTVLFDKTSAPESVPAGPAEALRKLPEPAARWLLGAVVENAARAQKAAADVEIQVTHVLAEQARTPGHVPAIGAGGAERHPQVHAAFLQASTLNMLADLAEAVLENEVVDVPAFLTNARSALRRALAGHDLDEGLCDAIVKDFVDALRVMR